MDNVFAPGLTFFIWRFFSAAEITIHVYFPIYLIRMSKLRGKVRGRSSGSRSRTDYCPGDNVRELRRSAARP
jgi:hypothetical protein